MVPASWVVQAIQRIVPDYDATEFKEVALPVVHGWWPAFLHRLVGIVNVREAVPNASGQGYYYFDNVSEPIGPLKTGGGNIIRPIGMVGQPGKQVYLYDRETRQLTVWTDESPLQKVVYFTVPDDLGQWWLRPSVAWRLFTLGLRSAWLRRRDPRLA